MTLPTGANRNYFLANPLLSKIDILLISETHFTNKNHITIPNYKIYNENHPNNKVHRDTTIIIK